MDPQYIQRKEDKKAESQMLQGSGRSFAPPGLELTAGEPIQKKDNPEKQESAQQPAQDAAGKDAVVQTDEAAVKEGTALSPIRQALMKQFDAFRGAKVGDKQFDQVVTQKEWDEKKQGEAGQQFNNDIDFLFDVAFHDAYVKKYEADMKAYPGLKKDYDSKLAGWWSSVLAWEKMDAKTRGPRPEKPLEPKKPMKPILPKQPAKAPVFTTCIATQSKMLSNALAEIGHEMATIDGKKTHSAFATDAQERSMKLGAWTEARPGITERPNPGDILVFSMRGGEMDKAAESSAYAHGDMSLQAQSVKSIEKKLAGVRKQLEAIDDSKRAASEVKESGLVKELEAAKAKYETYVAGIDEKLAKARSWVENNTDKLWFSHVSMFVSATQRPKDPDSTAKFPLETWDTFDGGQRVQLKGGGSMEGANDSKRTYDPNTNEISGEKQQGGKARWLKGWTNVDKLVGAQKPAKP
jgi:hypothetical protein